MNQLPKLYNFQDILTYVLLLLAACLSWVAFFKATTIVPHIICAITGVTFPLAGILYFLLVRFNPYLKARKK